MELASIVMLTTPELAPRLAALRDPKLPPVTFITVGSVWDVPPVSYFKSW